MTPDGTPRPSRRAWLAAVGAALTGCVGGRRARQTSASTPALDPLPHPTRGDPDAPVTVAAFEDFACPHCRTFALDVLPRLVEDHVAAGRVRYVHRDFPLPVDERWSWAAAVAARAVQAAAGDEAFFAYARRLYRRQDDLSLGLVARQAEAVGVDGTAVRRAVERERYRPTVATDRRVARERGIDGTPTVVVDGRRLDGYSYRRVDDAVAAALERHTF